MKFKSLVLATAAVVASSCAWSWSEPAVVTKILQHRDWVAVYLSPDPGKLNCDYSSPYLLKVDESAASQQRFSMVLLSLTTGKKLNGYADPCANAIWGDSRPTIERLNLLQ